jgi:predicted acylesterase/phospholipase RssA
LTGGGGHGLAHLGALRALEDAGVPVDVVGGTSQGALVGALYAAHASTSHMLPQARSISHWSPYDRVGVVNADP